MTSRRGVVFEQRLLHGIDTLAALFGRSRQSAPPHLVTGIRGEEEALFYLRKRGYTIVARRWQTPKLQGDVDLIAWDGDTLCFIEVKTRTGRDIVPAEFAVDGPKQKMLRSMAAVYRKRLPEPARTLAPIRFDVVAVYLPVTGAKNNAKPEIELFPAAFDPHPGRTRIS